MDMGIPFCPVQWLVLVQINGLSEDLLWLNTSNIHKPICLCQGFFYLNTL